MSTFTVFLCSVQVTQWGFAGENLGYIAFESADGSGPAGRQPVSEELSEKIDVEVGGRLGRLGGELRALGEGRIWPHADFGGTGILIPDASWMRSRCVGMRRDF